MIRKLVSCCCIEAMAEGIPVAMARLVETMGIPVVSWLAEVEIGSSVVAWSSDFLVCRLVFGPFSFGLLACIFLFGMTKNEQYIY